MLFERSPLGVAPPLAMASWLDGELGSVRSGVERHVLPLGTAADDPRLQRHGLSYLVGREGHGLVFHTVLVTVDNAHVFDLVANLILTRERRLYPKVQVADVHV